MGLQPGIDYYSKNISNAQEYWISVVFYYIDDSLLKKKYKDIKEKKYIKNKLYGHCYLVSEVLFHLFGGKDSGWMPRRLTFELDSNKITHWWIENPECSIIIDATSSQFDFKINYENGQYCSFLTKNPSKRCKIILDKIKNYK